MRRINIRRLAAPLLLTLTARRKVVKLPGLDHAVNRPTIPGGRKILLPECRILYRLPQTRGCQQRAATPFLVVT